MKKLFNKKGMTLVEVIVVLVILAILAAVLVPTMIGWIDKAKKKTSAAEARAVYLAAQTLASEKYAEVGEFDFDLDNSEIADDNFIVEVANLAGVGKDKITDLEIKDGKVTGIMYDGIVIGKLETPEEVPSD